MFLDVSWVSFAKSAPIPIRFPWNGLSLSLTAAFARIFVLSVYFRKATWIGLGLFLFLFNCVGVRWARSISTYFRRTFPECYKTPSYFIGTCCEDLLLLFLGLLAALILPSASYFLSFQQRRRWLRLSLTLLFILVISCLIVDNWLLILSSISSFSSFFCISLKMASSTSTWAEISSSELDTRSFFARFWWHCSSKKIPV